MFNPTSPVVGQTGVTGLTNPTFTLVEGTPPVSNAREFIVTTLGGTQTGVETHTQANPFVITAYRPTAYQPLGDLNGAGFPSKFPKNTYSVVTKKGTEVYSGIRRIATIKSIVEIPAGAEIQDPESVSAMLVMHAAVLQVNAAAIRDSLITGAI
jgi:hypothetical protein